MHIIVEPTVLACSPPPPVWFNWTVEKHVFSVLLPAGTASVIPALKLAADKLRSSDIHSEVDPCKLF